jgi:hypothetical protein
LIALHIEPQGRLRVWNQLISLAGLKTLLAAAARKPGTKLRLEPRRLPAGVTGRLGLPDPHGHFLVGRNNTVLLWRLGSELRALRLPLGEELTKS